MNNILSQIVERKVREVTLAKEQCSLKELDRMAENAPAPRSLRHSLLHTPGGIISEFKRRSPSKGWIAEKARVEDIIPQYESHGAAALSILTDGEGFGGALQDVRTARPLTSLPILRKDFVVDEFQLLEARAAGADVCLLIAAVLGKSRCHELARTAHSLELEVLLEIHSEEELDAWSPEVDVIGVNNRDLRTFRTDPANSHRLFPALPKESVPISESGILSPEIARELQTTGFQGFLIGEAFMATAAPGEALAHFINGLGI